MGQYPDFSGGQDNTAGWENTRPFDEEPTTPLAPGAPAPYAQPSAPAYDQAPTAPTYADPSPAPAYDGSTPASPYGGSAPYGAPASYPQGVAPTPSTPYSYGGYSGNPYAQGEHPQTQIVFILGIVGIFTGIPAFVAWYMGAQARKEIQAGAPYRWEGNLKTGYLLGKVFGIISIVGIALAVVLWIAYILFFVWLIGMGGF
jgi:hypothetical protein